ncbi:zeta-crystallin [Pseudovirgaria hyperparasitica]|uniref:Zeta-crystallin n=1 Tax=Pseudovirgaria hyperparasitica TaxID=470096 RepID=A0A6A6VYV1_9PEZI|nr:zeta-crystallin [Pseudovirgaria hyperparasitica]KAF2755405.1 zeta-crystallin [Pseudovirgaria hyperparasitica]
MCFTAFLTTCSSSAGNILVRVTHAAVTHVDLLYAQGLHQNNRRHMKPPFILGMEFAGNVAAAPKESKFSVGTRVFGAGTGAFGEYISVPEGQVREAPQQWTNAEACAVGASGAISQGALVDIAQIQPGQIVLVLGASGGLGVMAVQIAAAYGAKVIAVVGSEEKGEVVKRLGATHVVSYHEPKWEDKVKSFTPDGEGVHHVYDSIGAVQSSIRCLRYGGKVIIVGFAARGGKMEELQMNRILLKGVSVVGYRFGEEGRRTPQQIEKTWNSFMKLANEGKIKPVIYNVEYAGLESVPRALKDMEARKPWGRAIITIADEEALKDRSKL